MQTVGMWYGSLAFQVLAHRVYLGCIPSYQAAPKREHLHCAGLHTLCRSGVSCCDAAGTLEHRDHGQAGLLTQLHVQVLARMEVPWTNSPTRDAHAHVAPFDTFP